MSHIERFYSYVFPEPNTGCWLWDSSLCDGYGRMKIKNKTIASHRLSFTLLKGEIPESMHVLHTCDVRCCVNPDHLFLGTHQDNMDDRKEKGRGNAPKGMIHWKARLDNTQIQVIREAEINGFEKKKVQSYFKITREHHHKIIKHQLWK